MARSVSYWLACFCLASLVAPGFNVFESPDPNIARAFVETGQLSVVTPPKSTSYVRGRSGRYYTDHEIASDVVAAPAAFVAVRVERARHVPFATVLGFLMSFMAAGYFATTVVLLSRAGRLLGVAEHYTVASMVTLTLGSQYVIYAGAPPDVSLAAPVFAACLLAWMHAERGVRWGWVIAGVCAGLLPAIKLSNATAIPVLLVLAATSRGKVRSLAQLCAGLLPGALIVVGWNFVRTGHWLGNPYPPGLYSFHLASLPEGLLGTLLSPGKGLLVFTPALLFLPFVFRRGGVGRTHARIALFILGSLALTMVRFAGTSPWGSAGGWGIRYYVPWLPLLLWLLIADEWNRGEQVARARKTAGIVLLSAGMLINLSAVVTNFHYRQQLCGYDGWSWRSSNVCAVEALPGNVARIAGADVPDLVVPDASPATVFVSNRLSVWWYAIRSQGAGAGVSWAIGASLLLLAIAFWRLGRSQEARA